MSKISLILLLGLIISIICSQECDDRRDVVILVDSSSSVRRRNFEKVKNFLISFVDQLDIGSNRVRLGVVRFSSVLTKILWLNESFQKAQIKTTLKSMRYNGGGTNTDQALDFANREVLNINNGNRVDVPDLIFVITDGRSYRPPQTKTEANLLHEKGVDIVSIGVGGGVDAQELINIASNKEFALKVENFDQLKNESLHKRIFQAACSGLKTTPTPTPPPPPPTTTTTSTTSATTEPTTSAIITSSSPPTTTPPITIMTSTPPSTTETPTTATTRSLITPSITTSSQTIKMSTATNKKPKNLMIAKTNTANSSILSEGTDPDTVTKSFSQSHLQVTATITEATSKKRIPSKSVLYFTTRTVSPAYDYASQSDSTSDGAIVSALGTSESGLPNTPTDDSSLETYSFNSTVESSTKPENSTESVFVAQANRLKDWRIVSGLTAISGLTILSCSGFLLWAVRKRQKFKGRDIKQYD